MLEAAAQEVPTVQEEVKGSLAHGLHHLRRCYGKYIHQAIESTHCSMSDLVQEVRVVGIPKKVVPPALLPDSHGPSCRPKLKG